MKYVLSIDCATLTGIALIGYEESGPPVYVEGRTLDLDGEPRRRWLDLVSLAVLDLFAGREVTPSGVVWVVETWDSNRNVLTAIKLAAIQQVFIDAASLADAQIVIMRVLEWQKACGVTKVIDKRDGEGARKNAAKTWATSTYRLTREVDENIIDALCQGAVFVHKLRTGGNHGSNEGHGRRAKRGGRSNRRRSGEGRD